MKTGIDGDARKVKARSVVSTNIFVKLRLEVGSPSSLVMASASLPGTVEGRRRWYSPLRPGSPLLPVPAQQTLECGWG